jgi:hypothetical protein
VIEIEIKVTQNPKISMKIFSFYSDRFGDRRQDNLNFYDYDSTDGRQIRADNFNSLATSHNRNQLATVYREDLDRYLPKVEQDFHKNAYQVKAKISKTL